VLKLCTFEERVILAAQFGRTRAISFLLSRWEYPKNKLVTALAQRYGLSEHDAADARQEAVFWLLDAIKKYRFEGPRQLRDYRLKAFLRVMLKRHVANFSRGIRRRKLRLATAFANPNGGWHQVVALQSANRSRLLDPAEQCEEADAREATRRAIWELGDDAGRLYDALDSGCSLHEAAQQLQKSYDQTRRLRKHLGQALATARKPR